MRGSRRAAGLAVAAAALLVASGCGTPTPPDLARRTAPPPTTTDPAEPCTRTPPAGAGAGGGGGAVAATFDRGTNTIRLTQGQDVTPAGLRRAVGTDDALRQTAPGEWLLSANLQIEQGATLTVAAPDTRWLKLRSRIPDANATSTTADIASITVNAGGGLTISGSCVTSWDGARNKADDDYKNPRAYLLAVGGSMTIDKADLAFLGYGNNQSFGLSWRKGATGALTDSSVSYNYFGVYTYGVDGLRMTGNDVHHNALYGLDPHTDSTKLVIQGNTVHDNGKHGIILAERCTDSVISGNVVFRNAHHGIVLYQDSDDNRVEDNDTFLNEAQGININQAKNNTVTGNRSYDNQDSGIGVGQSQGNTITNNDIRGNQVDGIRLVTSATDNQLQNNLIGQNARYGVYVDSDGAFTLSGNTIWNNRAAVLLKGTTKATQSGNTMFGNQIDGIKSE